MSEPQGGRYRGGGYRGVVAVMVYVALLAAAVVAPLAQEAAPGAADSTAAAGVIPDSTGVPATLDPPIDRRHPRPERAASWITSDRVVNRLFEGASVSFLYGNVYLDRDSVVVRADSARVYRDRRFVRLFSNVQARSAGSRLASLEADYDRDSGDADFRGEVRVWEEEVLATADFGEMRDAAQMLRLIKNAVLIAPEFTVRADTLVRDRREVYGEAFGDVRIVDPGAATLVTGRHARYAEDGSWARVDREPALVTREEGGTPIRSVARDMQFFRTEERVVMTDSVQIRQGLTLAIADTAVVFGRERMLLTGRPEVSLGNDSRMRGDRISFFYSDGKLTRVILLGDARMEDAEPDSLAALYTGLPDLEVIEGDSIAVDFTDGEIHHTTVVGSGHSVYVPLDVEDEVAFNEVTGDTLVLSFEAGKVRQVDVRGSMRGTYHFARLSELQGRARADGAATDSLRAAAADSLATAADTLVAAADTLAVGPSDSLAAAAGDSLVAGAGGAAGPPWDFTRHAETVDYSGHAVRFDLQKMSITISQNAELRYGTMKLTADEVLLDTRTRELYARGKPMLQDKETIVGERLGYDFGNRTGAVRDGVTTFDGYYYVGDEIHRYPDGSVKIASGKMTSCDLAEPHYHFWSDRMKLRLGDQVVAAPIVLRVGHVPIFALPFYFKSLEAGRRSGILFPNFNFGWSSREGRYIRDMGYYWATNEYTDFTIEADYNERREFAWRLYNRYVKRYSFDGSAGYSRRQTFGEQQELKEWRLNWNHNQPKLLDAYQFRASVDMASATLSRSDLNANVGRDVVDSELKSTAYISRNFGLVNASVNLERTEQTNATDDDPTTNNVLYQMTLPSLNLSVRQITLAPALKPGQRGGFFGNLARNTYFSQGYSLRHNSSKRETTQQETYAAAGNWGLSVRPPRIGPFNPSFGATSSLAWQRDELTGGVFVRQVVPDTVEYYAPLDSVLDRSNPTLSFNAGATTILYGVFPVRVGPLRAIRHTFNFGASVSYRPRLGDKQLPGESYGFNVGNRFDAKYATTPVAGDSAETMKKVDGFLDWTMNTGYSPRAGSGQQWGTISSNVTVRPGQSRNLSIKMTNSIDPYTWSITQTSLSYGYGFQGRFDTGWRGEARETTRSAQIDRLGKAGGDSLAALADSLARAGADSLADPFDETADAGYYGNLGPAFDDQPGGDPSRDPTAGGRVLPWALSGSISYNRNNRQDSSTARAGVTLTTNLTRDWQFMYTTSVDLSAGTMTRQEYRLQRDLHCWALEFNRIVSAVDSQFGFRFYLKAIPELKLTQGKEDLMGSAGGLAGDAMFGGL